MTIEDMTAVLEVELPSEYTVILYIFPHNSTLVLQPLDNGVFKCHKRKMRKIRSNVTQAAQSSLIRISPDSLYSMETVDPRDVTTALERTLGLCDNSIAFDLRSHLIMSEVAWRDIPPEIIRAAFEVTGTN